VPKSLTDLVGSNVRPEDFLAAVLETAAQPIWVVDAAGLIQFANPAAIAALGYDAGDELLGHHSHEKIHYRHPDGSHYPAAECPMLLPRATGETVRRELDWFFRRDGSMFPVSYISAPIELREGRGAVVAFTDIEERLRTERLLREHEAILAARERALRRIAALVADGAASGDVFAAIAREVAQVLGMALVVIWRYEPGRPATVVAAWGDRPHPFTEGSLWAVEEHTAAALLPDIGRSARIEDFAAIGGEIAEGIAGTGIRSGTGAAIIVDGDVWGVMGAGLPEDEPPTDEVAERLAAFTELVATTISNSASRQELARLADEQAALRRVATLVAQGVAPSEVFAAVAREVGLLLGVDATHMVRYEPDGTATGVAAWSATGDDEGDDALGVLVVEPARVLDLRSAAGAPIVVDLRLWGVMVASSKGDRPLPANTEARIAAFTELVATALSNTEAREEVAASRARIVAATDEERRRVVRDLHDGAQQRLVHTIITLKLARRACRPGESDLNDLLGEALENAHRVMAELRELAHGILPAVLTQGGLRAGVDALAVRMPVPVETRVAVGRLPPAVEATAYFVVAEALTNVAKHARAHRASVVAHVAGCTLQVQVRDDGIGGAQPDGSGLLGLADRLDVLGGRLHVECPAEGGVLIAAEIPVAG
jgi:PAS domain S-box-containing protein